MHAHAFMSLYYVLHNVNLIVSESLALGSGSNPARLVATLCYSSLFMYYPNCFEHVESMHDCTQHRVSETKGSKHPLHGINL